MEDGAGKGYAPIHASRLLGELGAAGAIEPLLRQMVDTTWDEILHDTIIQVMPKFGAAVVEPALRLLGETDDPEVRHSVRAVLSDVGVRDDRILETLVAELEAEPDLGAMHLASYGDPSVLPLLHAAFDRHPVVRGEVFANQALIELEAAIEDLGGELTPAQKDKVERGIKARRAERSESEVEVEADLDEGMPILAGEKLGRNEPCWCGAAARSTRSATSSPPTRNGAPTPSRGPTSSRRHWISKVERGVPCRYVARGRCERVGKNFQDSATPAGREAI